MGKGGSMRYHIEFKAEVEAEDKEKALICAEQIEKVMASLFFVKASVHYSIEDVTGV